MMRKWRNWSGQSAGNVRPRLAVNGASDRHARHFVIACQRAKTFAVAVPLTQGNNVGIDEFGVAVRDTLRTTRPAASLLPHVAAVSSLATEPEVGRVNASWVVTAGAVVKDGNAFRDGTVVQLPRSTMSEQHLATVGELSVTEFDRVRRPQPTGIILNDALPELVLKSLGATLFGTLHAAKLRRLTSARRLWGKEVLPAGGTHGRNGRLERHWLLLG